jgi:hypothetical protein
MGTRPPPNGKGNIAVNTFIKMAMPWVEIAAPVQAARVVKAEVDAARWLGGLVGADNLIGAARVMVPGMAPLLYSTTAFFDGLDEAGVDRNNMVNSAAFVANNFGVTKREFDAVTTSVGLPRANYNATPPGWARAHGSMAVYDAHLAEHDFCFADYDDEEIDAGMLDYLYGP